MIYDNRVEAYVKRIRDLREDHDYNQQEIADHLNVAQTTYSDYERGKVRIPIDCMIKLAKFYKVDMNYICCFDESGN